MAKTLLEITETGKKKVLFLRFGKYKNNQTQEMGLSIGGLLSLIFLKEIERRE